MTHVTHKNAEINYLINCMNTCPITDTNMNHKLQRITTILHNNNYPTYKHLRKQKTKCTKQNTPGNKQKWATFTCIGKETRIIIRLFKNTNIRTSFKTTNTEKKI
jgi:hypothetical protein